MTLWSAADKLNEKNISFASGKELPFIGLLRVDGGYIVSWVVRNFLCRLLLVRLIISLIRPKLLTAKNIMGLFILRWILLPLYNFLPLYNYMNENKWRVPMADTYNVVNQKTRVTSWGRPVTGAYFIKLLEAVLDEKGNNIVSKDEMNCSK